MDDGIENDNEYSDPTYNETNKLREEQRKKQKGKEKVMENEALISQINDDDLNYDGEDEDADHEWEVEKIITHKFGEVFNLMA